MTGRRLGDPLKPRDPQQVGPYRLLRVLGQGGMARVYFGRSPTNRAVAVKVILPHIASDPAFIKGFRDEVTSARKVNGAYTPPVVEAGIDDIPPWVATVYVRGPSLKEAVRKQAFSETAIWRLAGGLVEALQDIHEHLIHRDLKPGNIMLDPDGPKVIDFGISAPLDQLRTTPGRPELFGLGTAAYMSPEQAKGEKIGPASDVFSLGSVIAFAATGEDLFGAGDPPPSWLAVVHRVKYEQPDLSRVPAALREVVAQCLEKDPQKRPTLQNLLGQITSHLAPEPDDSHASFWPDPLASLIRDRYDLTDPGPMLAEYPPEQSPVILPSMSGPETATNAFQLRTASPTTLGKSDAGEEAGRQPDPSGDPPFRRPPPPPPKRSTSRVRLGAIAGAAAITLTVLVTGMIWLVQPSSAKHGPSSALTDQPAQRDNDGLGRFTPSRQPAILQALTITPPELRLMPGHSRKLTLIGLVSSGKRLRAAQLSRVAWSTSDRSVATVNAFGKVTAEAIGKTKISAKVGKISASIEVLVTTSPAPSQNSGSTCGTCPIPTASNNTPPGPSPTRTPGPSPTHTPTPVPTTGTPTTLPP